MDIDTAQKGKTPGNACRSCGSTGHWAKDCHLWFDIHYMDVDEVEMALEDKHAARDVVLVEP
jgi:transposase